MNYKYADFTGEETEPESSSNSSKVIQMVISSEVRVAFICSVLS